MAGAVLRTLLISKQKKGEQGGFRDERFPTTILLATDGSEEGKLATQAAIELSKDTGSDLHMVYVLPTPAQLIGPHLYSDEIRVSLIGGAQRETEWSQSRYRVVVTGAPVEPVRLNCVPDAWQSASPARGDGRVRRDARTTPRASSRGTRPRTGSRGRAACRGCTRGEHTSTDTAWTESRSGGTWARHKRLPTKPEMIIFC
jgi:hypothetical protein